MAVPAPYPTPLLFTNVIFVPVQISFFLRFFLKVAINGFNIYYYKTKPGGGGVVFLVVSSFRVNYLEIDLN